VSIFFIELGFVTVGTEQDVRHPVRRSAHLLADHIQVNIRAAFYNQLIMNVTDDKAVPESLHGITANVKHFFTSLGNEFFTSYGKQFFTQYGKKIFTLFGKKIFTFPGKEFFTSPVR
jgi:hypothetical protein